MTTGHEVYAEWDGAYVLGALPEAEREEYERHLAVCAECRDALADLLPMPGLLSRVDEADRQELLAGTVPDAPPAGLEGRLLEAARAESPRQAAGAPVVWWRRTRTRVAVGLAAAAAVAAAVAVPVALREESPAPAASVTLRQTVSSPLSAQVTLTRTGWGTRIDMTCRYDETPGGTYDRHAYGLFVVDRDGHSHEVSTWLAGPGETARTSGSIDLDVDQLRTVQVRAADGVTVLLSAPV